MIFAHHFESSQDAWRHWELNPLILVSLAVCTVAFYLGSRRMAAAARTRGHFRWRATAFYSGVVVLGLTLVSPIDAVSGALFSVHMVQHLILMLIVAPLIAYAHPWPVLFISLPRRGRSAMRRAARLPLVRGAAVVGGAAATIVVVNIAGLWIWHLPGPYQAALVNDFLHGLEHATFLGIAYLLWALAFDAPRRERFGSAIAAFFITAMQSAALGAVLFLSNYPLYELHIEPAYRWGLQPLHDQQLAGALMWVPPGIAYLMTMIGLVWRWMARYEKTHPAAVTASGRGEQA